MYSVCSANRLESNYVGTDYDLPVSVVAESWCDIITTVLCTILLLQMLSCKKLKALLSIIHTTLKIVVYKHTPTEKNGNCYLLT